MYEIPLLYNPGKFDVYVHMTKWELKYGMSTLTCRLLTFLAFSKKGLITKMAVDHQIH